MPKKKSQNKRKYTLKEIADAFYSNEPPQKLVKMASTLYNNKSKTIDARWHEK